VFLAPHSPGGTACFSPREALSPCFLAVTNQITNPSPSTQCFPRCSWPECRGVGSPASCSSAAGASEGLWPYTWHKGPPTAPCSTPSRRSLLPSHGGEHLPVGPPRCCTLSPHPSGDGVQHPPAIVTQITQCQQTAWKSNWDFLLYLKTRRGKGVPSPAASIYRRGVGGG